MKVFICLAAALLYSMSVCAKSIQSLRSGRIVGGHIADPLNFPYQAVLEVKTAASMMFCGGSIISNQFVLTSAHCVHDALWVDVSVGVKRINETAEPTRQTFRVTRTKIIMHEQFDSALILNDVAFLKLSSLIQFNEFVQQIKLPSAGDKVIETLAIVSGFGRVADDSIVNSNVLKYVEVSILDIGTCQRNFYGNLVSENNICTSGYNGQGACHDDYGGPLVVMRGNEAVLIGVISFSWPMCEIGKPTVYSDVLKYLNWIKTVTNITN